MKKVQFKIDDIGIGIAQAKGFLWSDQAGIHFEYQVSDNIIELYKSEIKEAVVNYTQIAEVTYVKSWFGGGKIQIKLDSLKGVEHISFIKNSEINIKLKKSQKDNGKDFVVNTQLELANYNLAKLDA